MAGRKAKDRTGERYGMLVVLGPEADAAGGGRSWRCRCDCGKEVILPAKSLTSGVKSCGCASVRDLTGQRFGRLVVVERTDIRQGGHVVWACRCGCGGSTLVTGRNLTNGNTRSCGCLRKETLRSRASFKTDREKEMNVAVMSCDRKNMVDACNEEKGPVQDLEGLFSSNHRSGDDDDWEGMFSGGRFLSDDKMSN